MFRCSLGDVTKLKSLACYVYPVTTTQFTQSIRWKRKPRWIPVAKSKLFRIPVRPVIPAEEKLELFQLHAHYKTQMRAVKKFIREELAAETTSLENVDSEKSLLEESIDFKRCEEENNKWNAEVAVLRAQRLEQTFAKREEDILNSMARKDLLIQKLKEESDEKVRLFKVSFYLTAILFKLKDILDQIVSPRL